MFAIPVLLIFIIFIICIIAVVQYGDEKSHPRGVTISKINSIGNSIDFTVNGVTNQYNMQLPKSIPFTTQDKISISYQLNNKKITEIEEVFINDKLVWDIGEQGNVALEIKL